MNRLGRQLAASDAPHDWHLGLEPGDRLTAEPPWPDVTVEDAVTLAPKALVWQQVTVSARAPNGTAGERFVVGRVVAVFDVPDGTGNTVEREVEVGERVVVPAAVLDGGGDLSTCGACGAPLHDDAVLIDGAGYCRGCVVGHD